MEKPVYILTQSNVHLHQILMINSSGVSSRFKKKFDILEYY